jgi:hypothetical protein
VQVDGCRASLDGFSLQHCCEAFGGNDKVEDKISLVNCDSVGEDKKGLDLLAVDADPSSQTCLVLIQSLQKEPNLNGLLGNRIRRHPGKNRIEVQLFSQNRTLLVRPENLKPFGDVSSLCRRMQRAAALRAFRLQVAEKIIGEEPRHCPTEALSKALSCASKDFERHQSTDPTGRRPSSQEDPRDRDALVWRGESADVLPEIERLQQSIPTGRRPSSQGDPRGRDALVLRGENIAERFI